MNVLIVGLSDIASRRILPALRSTPGIGAIDIASSRSSHPVDGMRRLYSDYETALARSDAELVYISLVNSKHYEWARHSLSSGRHTIVDKPAFLQHEQTMELVNLANSKSLCLAEGTVFLHHPQFRLLRETMNELGAITRVSAAFSFPPLPEGNFRNQPGLGGGAIADIGPYVAGLARFHFKGPLQHCDCRVVARHPVTGVDVAFAVSLGFGDGASLVGQFGFDTQYQNRLWGFGPNWTYNLNRAFTTPPEMENEISLTASGCTRSVVAPRGDAFVGFCETILAAIRQRDWGNLTSDLIADSAMRDELSRASSGEAR